MILSGGVFFSLILSIALKDRNKARDRAHGGSDGMGNPNVLVGLATVIYTDYKAPSGGLPKNATSAYKSCRGDGGVYLPFEDGDKIATFDVRVKTNYKKSLQDMQGFVDRFIDCNQTLDKPQKLVKALLDLIRNDETLNGKKLYVQPDGRPISTEDIQGLDEVNLAAFLLGIWHYIIANRISNKEGKDTYDILFPSNAGKQRDYAGNLGENISRVIRVITASDTTYTSPQLNSSVSEPTRSRCNAFAEYLKKASDRYNVMKLIGGDEVKLKDYFVCNYLGEQPSVFGGKGGSKQRHLEQPTLKGIREAFSYRNYDNKYTILIGSGGSGKSLMMQHMFLLAAEEYPSTGVIPVFLELRHITQSYTIESFLEETIQNKAGLVSKEEIRSELAKGNMTLLMDGFDEIDQSDLKSFQDTLDNFIDKYDKVQIVMSSRDCEDIKGLKNFTKLYVWPFNTEQTQQLIDKILKANNAEYAKDEIVGYIKNGFINKNGVFASHPMLLTFVAMHYKDFDTYKHKHLLFYKKAYEALLTGHDDNKKPYARIFLSVDNADDFTTVFQEFCGITYADGVNVFDESTFEDYFTKLESYKTFKNPYKMKVHAFKHDTCSTACMMYEQRENLYYIDPGFQAFSFAEYYMHASSEQMLELGIKLNSNPTEKYEDLEALQMLYDNVPEKVNTEIFLPFLKNIFKGKNEKDRFINYLISGFDQISYSYIYADKIEAYQRDHSGRNIEIPDSHNASRTVLLSFLFQILG